MATSMVTGGTSGIGREFVTQLAARGDDIVIVARDTERMAAIKADVEARYGVSVETIAEDLSRREDVDQALADLGDEGAGLRVTPWRTVVLRDPPADARARLEGLVETGPSPWSTLSACVGAPRCAKSHTDVRGDLARAVADEWTAREPHKPRFVAGVLGPTSRTCSISPRVIGWR